MAKSTFDTIDGGGLAEQFRLALAQIGRNIIDPNMDPKEKRGLVVNLNFIPGETGGINVEYSVKTKLAGSRKGSSLFLIGQDAKSGKIQMTEYGNNRPQVAVYSAGNPGPAEKECDPNAGEILDEETRGPIDLRA